MIGIAICISLMQLQVYGMLALFYIKRLELYQLRADLAFEELMWLGPDL